MGVYIPNMSKPKSCGECRFESTQYVNNYCRRTFCNLGADYEHCPLIEIDEPKVGKWIDTNMTCYGSKVYKCSVCDNEIDEMPTEMGEPIWNYCPNCGAKMERRADDD